MEAPGSAVLGRSTRSSDRRRAGVCQVLPVVPVSSGPGKVPGRGIGEDVQAAVVPAGEVEELSADRLADAQAVVATHADTLNGRDARKRHLPRRSPARLPASSLHPRPCRRPRRGSLPDTPLASDALGLELRSLRAAYARRGIGLGEGPGLGRLLQRVVRKT